jgi:flagellar protein FliS
MINQPNPYLRYQQTRVETAGPLQLVIMLYDGAIRFINQGKQAMINHDFSQTNTALKRAEDIIDELTITLNPAAGEITDNLARLYEFVNYRLIQANVKKEPEMLDDAVRVLSTLRSAWVELQAPDKEAVGR